MIHMTVSVVSAPPSIEKSAAPPNPALYRIRDLIYNEAGIFHPDNKLRFLEDRCGRRMKQVGVISIRDYYDCLAGARGKSELVNLLNEITIGETYFFRNQPQMDAFRQIVLPKLLQARAADGEPLRIWSAGCSTGEEPYTLSILLLEAPEMNARNRKFEIHATDLNESSIEHARKAVYGEYSTRKLDPAIRAKYFQPAGDCLLVSPRAQAHVRFLRLNLLDQSRMSMMKKMDVIFCCNVLIYFDRESKAQAIGQFADVLLPHGYLFIGHSESLFGISDRFRLVHFPCATAYVKANSVGQANRVNP